MLESYQTPPVRSSAGLYWDKQYNGSVAFYSVNISFVTAGTASRSSNNRAKDRRTHGDGLELPY
jgi:hypothetical protein